jgi:hypothetical protein
MMSVAVGTLVLVAGATEPIRLRLRDDNGNAEDLSEATAATYEIRVRVGDATPVVAFSTATADLAFDAVDGALVATPSAGQVAALVAGSYVSRAWVTIAGRTLPTKRIVVVVEASGAAVPS